MKGFLTASDSRTDTELWSDVNYHAAEEATWRTVKLVVI